MLRNIRSWFSNLPNKKPYIELVVAALTIPVLLTVILLNFTNLNSKNDTQTNSTPVVIESNSEPTDDDSKSSDNQTIVTPNPESCKDQVGPVSIATPIEGVTVSDNPVNFIIKYQDPSYCSVVWSYRINNGTWSEFSSSSPAIYNLPFGSVKFDLRVQSTVSGDQELLTRNFVYISLQVSPSPSPSTK